MLCLSDLPGSGYCGTDQTNQEWKVWLRTQVGHECACANPFACPPCQLAMMLKLGADFQLEVEEDAPPLLPNGPLKARLTEERSSRLLYSYASDQPPGYLVAHSYSHPLPGGAWGLPEEAPVPLEATGDLEGWPCYKLSPHERARRQIDRLEEISRTGLLPVARDSWAVAGNLEEAYLQNGLRASTPEGVYWLVRDPARLNRGYEPCEKELPADLPDIVMRLAREIAPLGSPRRKAEEIERFLQTEFTYGFDHQFHDRTPVLQQFLEERPPVHCEFFATVMALMLRVLDIPSRYLVGFPIGARQWDGTAYLLRATNCHAFVEAYLPGEGWVFFDPTPPDGRLQPPAQVPEPPRNENFKAVDPALKPEEIEAIKRDRTAPGWLKRVLHHLRDLDVDGLEESPELDPRRLLKEMLRRRCSASRATRRQLSARKLLVCVDLSGSCAGYCKAMLHAAVAMQRGDDGILVCLNTNGVPFDWLRGGRTQTRVLHQLRNAGRNPAALAKLIARAGVGRVLTLGDCHGLPLWHQLHRTYGRKFTWLEPTATSLIQDKQHGVPRWRCDPERLGEALLKAGSPGRS